MAQQHVQQLCGRLISRYGNSARSPRSPVRGRVTFFSGDYLEDKVYRTRPAYIQGFKTRIPNEISVTIANMPRHLMKNLEKGIKAVKTC
jgi:hypothetical protein